MDGEREGGEKGGRFLAMLPPPPPPSLSLSYVALERAGQIQSFKVGKSKGGRAQKSVVSLWEAAAPSRI